MKKTLTIFTTAIILGVALMVPVQTAQAQSCRALAAKLGIQPKALNAYIAKCRLARASSANKRTKVKARARARSRR